MIMEYESMLILFSRTSQYITCYLYINTCKSCLIFYSAELLLTFDIQLNEIRNAISFDIGSCAWIVSCVPPGDSLKDEALVAHDNPRSDVVLQGTSLQKSVLATASASRVGCQEVVKSNPFQLLWCYQNFAPLFLHKSRTIDVTRKVRQCFPLLLSL